MRGRYLAIALAAACASGGEFPGDGGGEGSPDAVVTGGGVDGSGIDAVVIGEADASPVIDAVLPPDARPPDAAPCVGGNVAQVFNGHCYLLFTNGRNWTNAQADCQAQTPAAHLVTIQDVAENDFVDAFVGGRGVWMGATDVLTEMSWTWITGEPWAYTKWDGGEPNDDGTEDCGVLKGGDGGRWNDAGCGDGKDYVCERE